ncbi:hypothetical protein D3C72_1519330 [compost metagenome]
MEAAVRQEPLPHRAEWEISVALYPLIDLPSRRDPVVIVLYVAFLAGGFEAGLPCFDQATLVALQLIVDEQVVACPSRSLLKGAIIIADRPFDTLRRDLDIA